MKLTERLQTAAFQQGYHGPALQCGGDEADFERGMIAARVAEWCGVDISVAS
jgi:hypothetical protein